MRGKPTAWLPIVTILLLTVATGARARIFLGGSYGWLENNIYENHPAMSPYMGGAGGSLEAGFDIGRISLSGEYGPSYNQPYRHIVGSRVLGLAGPGKYKLLLGNLMIRLEPIESLQPYLLLGGGQGEFTFDYGKGVLVDGKLITSEKMKSWLVEAGFGFESPIRSWLRGGIRGRFLYNRWRPKTDMDRYPPYESGNGYSVDLTLKILL